MTTSILDSIRYSTYFTQKESANVAVFLLAKSSFLNGSLSPTIVGKEAPIQSLEDAPRPLRLSKPLKRILYQASTIEWTPGIFIPPFRGTSQREEEEDLPLDRFIETQYSCKSLRVINFCQMTEKMKNFLKNYCQVIESLSYSLSGFATDEEMTAHTCFEEVFEKFEKME